MEHDGVVFQPNPPCPYNVLTCPYNVLTMSLQIRNLQIGFLAFRALSSHSGAIDRFQPQEGRSKPGFPENLSLIFRNSIFPHGIPERAFFAKTCFFGNPLGLELATGAPKSLAVG